VYKLADYLAGRGHNFELPADGRARIDCGAMSFCLDPTERAEQLPRRWFAWRWDEHKFTLGSVLALGLFVLMIFAVPPEGMSLSNDMLGMSRPVIPFTIAAPKPEDIPEILKQKDNQGAGEAGKLAAGESGKMGDRTSKKTNGKAAVKGDGKDMHVGAPRTADEIRKTGLLGVLSSAMNSKFAGIFGRDTAVGSAKDDILGNLIGTEFGSAYGISGLGQTGSGAGGGGTGQLTMGPSIGFGTVGPGYGHGAGIGALERRPAKIVPSVGGGIATVRGSLDKEIIRRVVRLHMNEVKYCYDQELGKRASLEGRISVQFVISPLGQVLSSVLNSSTMNNLRVEKCVVDAVKRWDFPKPTGGGIAIVAYPFNFVAGAGG
jgi:TonB family protein